MNIVFLVNNYQCWLTVHFLYAIRTSSVVPILFTSSTLVHWASVLEGVSLPAKKEKVSLDSARAHGARQRLRAQTRPAAQLTAQSKACLLENSTQTAVWRNCWSMRRMCLCGWQLRYAALRRRRYRVLFRCRLEMQDLCQINLAL